MNELFDIKNKVVAITGSTGVLAGSLAKYLASQGAKVVFMGRSKEKLDAATADLDSADTLACVCDVLDRPALEKARSDILAKFGRLDALINGAGGNMSGATIPPDKTFFDLEVDQWAAVVKLNLQGTLLPTMVFGEIFRRQKFGSIVNFSSMTAEAAVTRVLGYSNAKAGVNNLTKWLAVEFAQKFGEGIRVNAIAPGFFISEQNRALLTNPDGSFTQRGQTVINKTPFKRFGNADEIHGAAHYLISDASKFVTGTIMAIDGGFSCFSGV